MNQLSLNLISKATVQNGFNVTDHEVSVAKRIKSLFAGGGYLLPCARGRTFDIALTAEGIDIVGSEYDGDDSDADARR